MANETWFKLRAQMEAMVASREGTFDEPVNSRPTGRQIQDWTTSRAKGYAQQVEVIVRERATGELISVPFTVTGRRLVSRRNVIKQALSVYTGEGASAEGQQILGAVYTGTYRMIPAGGR